MNDTLRQIEQWFEAAKPEPKINDVSVQLGCHFEEVAEMMEVLTSDVSTPTVVLEAMASKFKSKKEDCIQVIEQLSDEQKGELLDALCDQIVTAIGVAKFMGMDILGHLQNVADSNNSKFADGKYPIFDNDGKIMKGPDYFVANPMPYIVEKRK